MGGKRRKSSKKESQAKKEDRKKEKDKKKKSKKEKSQRGKKDKKGSHRTRSAKSRKKERTLGGQTKKIGIAKPIAERSAPDQPAGSETPTSETPDCNTPELEPDPDHAAKLLREAVNSEVSAHCKELAEALIKTAGKGKMSGARILVEITGAGKIPPGERKADVSHLDITRPEVWEAEPQWKDPEIGDIWVGNRWETPAKPVDPERPPDQ